MKHGVPQGSVLGPLLFLIYINDLHKSIKYCSVRHFADDTNFLISNNSPKKIQDHVNSDLKHLCRWLRANKISLNKSKTELLIFKHLNKKTKKLITSLNSKWKKMIFLKICQVLRCSNRLPPYVQLPYEFNINKVI